MQHPSADMVIGLSLLFLLALLSDLLTRRIGLGIIRKITLRTEWRWDDALYRSGTFKYIAHMAPTLIIQYGVGFVPDISKKTEQVITNAAMAGTLFFGMLAVGAILSALQNIQLKTHSDKHVPYKGYIQLFKIIIYVVGTIAAIAIFINRSPLILLSGLGALSAVLLLIFKDTLLGFVASVQISSNDMLRVGDWIEMPSAGADGDVIDISLHTVKVRNWDKTITTIPTWKLISDSFKNWRGMFDSGGRRIKRSVLIDSSTVRFLNEQEITALKRIRLLDSYLASKQKELQDWNATLGSYSNAAINQRRLTNLGTFRAYAQAYLDAHPGIHRKMTCMVRQMANEGEGIPLEIYCFTAKTSWVDYEAVQGDIFDHFYAVLAEFDLGLYQKPVGADIRRAAGQSTLRTDLLND